MTEDPKRLPEEDGERVGVRDRIDPDTGAVTPDGGDVLLAEGGQPSGAAPAADGPVGDTDERVAALTVEVAERTADLQRLSAEYANYRRRIDRDREAVLVNARAQFVGELLTVLDDIERAGAHGDLTGPFKSVADKLISVVQKLGLEPFGTQGEPFDPSVHEAVQHEDAEVTGPAVTVLSTVMRRGYRIGDRVLRPAMVGVVDRADDGTARETAADAPQDVPPATEPGSGQS